MAKWVVSKSNGVRHLDYHNLVSGQCERLSTGGLRADTTNELVIDWIVRAGDPNPGDIVVFADDGLVVQIMGAEQGGASAAA